MHDIAFWGLLLSLALTLLAGAAACMQAVRQEETLTPWLERANILVAALVTMSSTVLLRALVDKDFSFLYVSEYTDSVLPLFYAVTAFWAGQAGSLLFWAWSIILIGAFFPLTRSYERMGEQTRSYYWIFYLVVQGFFLLLLTTWSNPFTEIMPPPPDGRGLNPLLQNPGMIFHPPLLFLGYALFTVPACLALAATLAGKGDDWLSVTRNWTLSGWIFLTAGIVLGGWWSYMELGWGGYWAWDPVENASLIPWLSASAFLHTAVIQHRRKALPGTNVFLISLTLVICIFATYLVRSGVIDSLHAFGDGGVGGPLLVFILFWTALTAIVVWIGKAGEGRELGDILSRTGVLFVAAWMFLALGLVVFLGTMWPVISSIWSDNPLGMDAGFYNRVCLPLFAIIGLFLVVCPWLGWKGGIRDKRLFFTVLGTFLGAMILLAFTGMTQPVALAGAASGLAVIVGLIGTLIVNRGERKLIQTWGFVGIHIGLALIFVGIAFSGPYKVEAEAFLEKGKSMQVGPYTVTYDSAEQIRTKALNGVRVAMTVTRDGKLVGELKPERRIYKNFERQVFAEVSTIPSLGDEIYATLLGYDSDENISVKISVNPLVNWIWIGGTLMCLAGFLCYRSPRGRKVPDSEEAVDAG